uniref:Roundabout guidance receptor 3 n=1 Tax=Pelodiscus sinensis TaxID=13735 RepID=K7FYA6_PELSI
LPGSRPRLEDSSPHIVEHPSDLIVSKGEPATLNCKAEGRPTPIIEWYKDGERVETDKEDPRSHRMLLPSGSLSFLRIVHGRSITQAGGVYDCFCIKYQISAATAHTPGALAVLRDDFRQAPSDVVLECVPPRGHPEPTISWKKNSVRISDKDERITVRPDPPQGQAGEAGGSGSLGVSLGGDREGHALVAWLTRVRHAQLAGAANRVQLAHCCGARAAPPPGWLSAFTPVPRRAEIQIDNTLRLSRVSAEDEGTYTCVAENSVGKAEASGSLSVHVPPRLVTHPRDQIVAQGRTVTFHCETKGNPPPAVFWQKEGSQILLFPSQPPQPLGRGEMTITEVQRADSGYYMCQAISVAGSILAKALLEVEDVTSDHFPPIIRRGPANQTLAVGATAQLTCRGNLLPSVQWLKDGQQVVGRDTRASLSDNGTLQITNSRVSDSGRYVCMAASATGKTEWSGVLTVQEPGADLQVQLSEPGHLPGPPSAPLVTNVTRNSVTLAWKPSPQGGDAPGGVPLPGCSQSAGSTWQTVADNVRVEKHTVSDLSPDTIYLFLIRAANAQGLSDPSPVSEPVRTQGAGPGRGAGLDWQVQRELSQVAVQLQAPVILTSTAIQVSWTVNRQAQFLQGYRVLYRPRGGAWQGQDVPVPAQRRPLLLELHNAPRHSLTSLGHGRTPIMPPLAGLPGLAAPWAAPLPAPSAPPQEVSVVAVGNSTSSSVSWEPPPAGEQNGLIQNYQVGAAGESRQVLQCPRAPDHRRGEAAGLHRWPGRGLLGRPHGLQPLALLDALSLPLLCPVPAAEPAPEQGEVPVSSGEGVSLAEQITDVVKQPAFIAGLGGACWVVLMGFSLWLYWRRKKRKELSHYT